DVELPVSRNVPVRHSVRSVTATDGLNSVKSESESHDALLLLVVARPASAGVAKTRNGLYRRLDLFGGDKACAFKLARRIRMTRAPEEVFVVEPMPHVVPAAVAGMIVDDAVRGVKFVCRMGQPADHHYWRPDPPSQPREPA